MAEVKLIDHKIYVDKRRECMRRLALCIGNNEYSYLPPLSCAINDANGVADSLQELGFETRCECDLDRAKMIDVITDFIEDLSDYDSCVFYYAGHGCQIDGDNILAPVDLNINGKSSSVKYNAFPLEDLMRQLDKYPDKTKIFVFDACRTVLNDRGTTRGFAPLLAPQGSIIAFATSPGQSSAEDKDTGHGYYTNALLQFIKLPRVNIETVFKKTREQMVALFGTHQIPWEHTSLVGDYYLNPNTIYDGVNYSPEAFADSRFQTRDSNVRKIVDDLKSYNWYTQGPALKLLETLNYSDILASDLFVIGRNIYQASSGGCFDAQSFINDFVEKDIPEMAKLHLLNGIAYEIYFNSKNTLRLHPKVGYYCQVIRLLELDEFYGSKTFISSALYKYDNQILYIPGQNEIMEFTAILDSDNTLQSIVYRGQNVLFGERGEIYDYDNVFPFDSTLEQLTNMIARQVAAPVDFVIVHGIDEIKIHIPFSFTIRKSAIIHDVD